ncbi:phosphate acyltransferase PlsX [Lentisalinibacter salinarum]|uniref:phosphate acyltransferase PlsX n=1 Tax=Lentisalinibacter salinarum TaxID=2992239 RepID=UPI00386B64B0
MQAVDFIIALDAMSGDLGPGVVVAAARQALRRHPALAIALVGDEAVLEPLVAAVRDDAAGRLVIRHAPEIVTMNDAPVDALRRKKQSSMRVAVDLVKQGEAQACVSAGNTGALMAIAKFVLKTVQGIDRPAILAEMPARGGSVHMLDLGANADCTAEQLFQFAMMGSVVTGDVRGLANPRVALLNIGEEEIKGDQTVKAAAALLGASGLNYVGYVEGNDIISGKTDVVVTDGFTGNVALKTMEGTAGFISEMLKAAFTETWLSKLQALAAQGVLGRLRARLDPRHYNGASLVGLTGIVVKSHGSADELAFLHAIETAVVEVEHDVPSQIGRLLQREAA